jgi:hypothetical protein
LTNDERFDDLARRLAQPRTRRGAIRVAAGGLGGLLLGAVGIRASGVEAQRGPGNPCHAWCNANFHTRAEITACIAAANKGQGPCYECGAAAPPDSPPFCDGVCCQEGQECVDGTCVTVCDHDETQGNCFGQGECNGGGNGCACSRTWDDGNFCHQSTSCGSVVSCTTTADCPPGWACAYSCCDGLTCLPPCNDVTPTAATDGGQMSAPG